MRFRDFLILLEALDPEIRRNRKEMVKHFKNLNNYSVWNAEHSMEVAKIARDFGKYLGLDSNRIVKSALTHDVGKITIRKDLLHKPGYFDEPERAEMKSHVGQSSNDILKSLTGDHKRLAMIGAEFHHTTPEGLQVLADEGKLSETDVELIKVITIADVFEALVSDKRPYKEGISRKEALVTMAKMGHIDKDMFEKFKKWQLSEFTQFYR